MLTFDIALRRVYSDIFVDTALIVAPTSVSDKGFLETYRRVCLALLGSESAERTASCREFLLARENFLDTLRLQYHGIFDNFEKLGSFCSKLCVFLTTTEESVEGSVKRQ